MIFSLGIAKGRISQHLPRVLFLAEHVDLGRRALTQLKICKARRAGALAQAQMRTGLCLSGAPPCRFEDGAVEFKLDTQDSCGRCRAASQRTDKRTFSRTNLADVILYGARRIRGLLLCPAQQGSLEAQGLKRPLLALAAERSKPLPRGHHWTISRIFCCVSPMVNGAAPL
jgi:hypothetical protein